MKKIIFGLFITLILLGCASSSTPNFEKIVQIGPDTYTISDYSIHGSEYTRMVSLKLANKFAASKGKCLMLLNENSWGGSYTVVFRVVNQNDPEYKRPQYEQRPDILINVREK